MVRNDAKVDWGAAFMVAVLLPVAVDVEGVVAVLTGALDKVAGAGSVPVPVAVAAEAAAADVGASEEDVRTARVLVNVDVGVLDDVLAGVLDEAGAAVSALKVAAAKTELSVGLGAVVAVLRDAGLLAVALAVELGEVGGVLCVVLEELNVVGAEVVLVAVVVVPVAAAAAATRWCRSQ